MSDVDSYNSYSVYKSIRETLVSARKQAFSAVNASMVLAYWEVGREIFEAVGEHAEYGASLLKFLSEKLSREFGSGFDVSNLRRMRQFYILFPKRAALRRELSWTHYKLLMGVSSEKARAFYLDECVKSQWSTRQLERQIHSFYYERLLSSQDKASVAAEIERLEPRPEYENIVKDPYVLEFLGLKATPNLYESSLEQSLIDNLQSFLLELGRGFSFVARQKRISFDDQHFYIDLVFYNYVLKCFVLIDLKVGKLTHQDLGQMQMYVNFYTRELMNEGDNPPIGIVLCADKSDSLVRYTLPEGESQVFASKYMLYMPDEAELSRVLNRWFVEESEVRYVKEGGI